MLNFVNYIDRTTMHLQTIIANSLIYFTIHNKTTPIDNDTRLIIMWLREYSCCINTFIAYRVIILRYFLWLKYNNLSISATTSYHFLAYAEFLRAPPPSWCNIHRQKFNNPDWRPLQKPLSLSSIKRNLLKIRQMYIYLFHSGYIDFKVFNLRLYNYRQQPPATEDKYLTETEYNILLTYISKMPDNTQHLQHIKQKTSWLFKLLYYTGCRRNELATATMDDIIFDGRKLWLKVTGKGSKPGKIPIVNELFTALEHYRQFWGLPSIISRKKSEAHIPLIIHYFSDATYYPILSGQIWFITKSICVSIASSTTDLQISNKFLRISPHWFRHTSATHQIDSGIDLRIVQQNLRHSNAKTTLRYVHQDATKRHAETVTKFPANLK